MENTLIKKQHKEISEELQGLKRECAATLLGKEESNLKTQQDLHRQVSDLEYQNQKLVQKINDCEL